MPVIKYYNEDPLYVSAEDLMPMVLIILDALVDDCLKWSMMIVVDIEYPDLKEWISYDQLSLEDLELLDLSIDPRVSVIVNYIKCFVELMEDYLNLFPFDLEKIHNDEHLLGLAEDLYGLLIYEVEDENDESYYSRLMTFAECVLQILYCLCELVIYGKVDLETTFEEDGSCYKLYDRDWDHYIDAEVHEFSLLAKLMEETLHFQNELFESFP